MSAQQLVGCSSGLFKWQPFWITKELGISLLLCKSWEKGTLTVLNSSMAHWAFSLLNLCTDLGRHQHASWCLWQSGCCGDWTVQCQPTTIHRSKISMCKWSIWSFEVHSLCLLGIHTSRCVLFSSWKPILEPEPNLEFEIVTCLPSPWGKTRPLETIHSKIATSESY